MGLERLRDYLRSEHNSARLTEIPHDLFEKEQAEISSLIEKVHTSADPTSDESRDRIEVSVAMQETLMDLFLLRSRKILTLTLLQTEGNCSDRTEIRRMTVPEKKLFEEIRLSLERCQRFVLSPLSNQEVCDESNPHQNESESTKTQEREEDHGAHGTCLVWVLHDIEPFLGIDGLIYSLKKGDIVTLPAQNAEVLCERNIVLNMDLLK